MRRAHGIPADRRSRRRAASASLRCGLLLGALLAGASCASKAPRPVRPEYDLRDPSATRRLEAVSTVERSGDRTQVPALIERLDDDDDGVRMAAGSALKALTGHDTGYRAFAPPEERRRQVALWRAWWTGSGGGAPSGRIGASAGGGGYTGGGGHDRAP